MLILCGKIPEGTRTKTGLGVGLRIVSAVCGGLGFSGVFVVLVVQGFMCGMWGGHNLRILIDPELSFDRCELSRRMSSFTTRLAVCGAAE